MGILGGWREAGGMKRCGSGDGRLESEAWEGIDRFVGVAGR